MKKYIKYIGLLFVVIMTFSCNKENFNYKPGYVGISKITQYPNITVSGPAYVAVPKGGVYTDPGVSAKAGSATVPVVTSGLPDVNTAGVYTVTYTAVNSDGFAATASRTVAVYSTDVTAQNNDFSGTYARTSNGQIATWTKLAPGVYLVNNVGGSTSVVTVVMFNPTAYKIYIPSQIVGGNATSSTNESTVPGAGGTLVKYSITVLSPLFLNNIRTFVKQ